MVPARRLAVLYTPAGLIACVLIGTVPFGIASFRLVGYALWPFGRRVVVHRGAGVPSLLGNVLWIVLFGGTSSAAKRSGPGAGCTIAQVDRPASISSTTGSSVTGARPATQLEKSSPQLRGKPCAGALADLVGSRRRPGICERASGLRERPDPSTSHRTALAGGRQLPP